MSKRRASENEIKKKRGVEDQSKGYQNKVITLIAVCLSSKENVEKYVIYSEVEGISLFEDLIVKVWFKNEIDPYCYLVQVKHRVKEINFNREKHKLHNYVDTIRNITHRKNEIIFLRNVPVNNIEFWLYTNNNVDKNNTGKMYKLEDNENCTSLFHPPLQNNCHKLIPKLHKGERNVDNLHFILNQPENHKIEDQIKELNDKFTTAMTKDLIKYIENYFNGNKIRGLTKTIFETELLRIHLSTVIIKPVKALEIKENPARIWNDICLSHEFTIIEAAKDMEMCIFGSFLCKINELYECNLDWNHYVSHCGKFDETFLSNWELKNKTHWNSVSDSLEALIIEMWKVGDLPLLLKSTGDVSILNKYRHLKKHYIIIGNVKEICFQIQQFNEALSLPIRVFIDVASIHPSELRDELLKEITVSLQGRKPTSLYSITDGDHGAMKELPCDKILHLIRKRSLFLQKELFDKTEWVIYIIVTEKIETGYDFDFEKVDYEINEKIKCKDFEVKDLEERIKAHSILQYYKQCRVRLNNDKYESLVHEQIDEFMKNFAVDQDGKDIYGLGDHKLAPVIGERLKKSEACYIQRYLETTLLPESILEEQKSRVIFLWGDLNSLTQNNRKRLITVYDEYRIKQKLERNETVLIDANELTVQECKLKYSSENCLFLMLEDGYLMLIGDGGYCNLQTFFLKERNFFKVNLKKIIISGEPGIGKSSLLKSLAVNYNENNYVLFCNLSDYRYELQQKDTELLESPLEFIFNKNEKSFYKAFLQKIFNLQRENGKMILFLDSFDEVLPYYKEKVLSILDKIANLNVKFIISSRTHANNILVEKLKTKPMKIENLNREDVKKYLKERRSIDIDLESIFSKFLENPLYLQFLISLQQEELSKFSRIDQFELYEMFIYKKVERYHKKYKKDYNPNLKNLIDKILKCHKLMALMVLFDSYTLKNYDSFENYIPSTEEEREEICRMGFIKHFDENNFPVFSHRTFAEFLASQWIKENYSKESFAKQLHREIIKSYNYSFNELYNNVICKDLKLHKAVLADDIKLVEQLCSESNVYLEEVDKTGRTAFQLLYDCCTYKPIVFEIMEIIMKHMRNKEGSFANIDFTIINKLFAKWDNCTDSKTEDDENPLNKQLVFAIENNLKTCAEYLLEIKKVQPNFSCLKLVAEFSGIDLLEKLIEHGGDITEKDENNNTILHSAARNCSRPDVIRYVIDTTVNINQRNFPYGRTPLHEACRYDNVVAITELLKKGANPNVIDMEGEYPIHYIMSSGSWDSISGIEYVNLEKKELIKKLINDLLDKLPEESTNREGHTLFHKACMQENIEIVNYLLNKYPNVTTFADTEGNTCFHLASRLESKSVISILTEKMDLKSFANLEMKNNKKETPLHVSVKYNSHDVTEFLLERGHDPNVFDENGKTALHVAVDGYSVSLIKLLLKKGAEVNCSDKGWQTCYLCTLYKTTATNDPLETIVLLSKNAKMNLPLHSAMTSQHELATTASLDSSNDHAELIFLTQQYRWGMTLLHYACKENCERVVDYLLKKIRTSDIHIKNEDGKTLFHLACLNNSIDIVKRLLRDHPEVVELDNDGNTCLHLTAREQTEDVFFILVKKMGFNEDDHLEIKNNFGKTLLHESVKYNSFRITEFLLEREHDPNCFDKNGNSPLHLAAKEGNIPLINLLLEKGAEINCRNNNMQTPLHLAFKYMYSFQRELAVKTLLNNGATVNLKDKNGDTPLHLAIRLFSRSVVNILIENLSNLDDLIDVTQTDDQDYTLLHHACENGHEEAVEYLLKDLGKDAVHVKNKIGKTPFHLACEKGNTKIVECLLRHDPEITNLERLDDNGNTFWHLLATSNVFFDFIKRFDSADNLEIRNDLGQTPLHMSVKHRLRDVTKYLLERGLDPNLCDKNGDIPLHYKKCEDCIDILVESGSNINARNSKLETPLHKAVQFKHQHMVKKLLKRGADVNTQDIEGNTPLHIAIQMDYEDDKFYFNPFILLKLGANLNIRNRKGETVLDIAKSLGRKYFLLYLEEIEHENKVKESQLIALNKGPKKV